MENNTLQTERADLIDQLDGLDLDRDESQEQMENLEDQVRDLNAENLVLSQSLARAEELLEEITRQRDVARTERDAARTQRDTLKAKVRLFNYAKRVWAQKTREMVRLSAWLHGGRAGGNIAGGPDQVLPADGRAGDAAPAAEQ
jgi:chromosome segregation ATPase